MTPNEMLKQAEEYLEFARNSYENNYPDSTVQTLTALAEAHTNLAFTMRHRNAERDSVYQDRWTTSL